MTRRPEGDVEMTRETKGDGETKGDVMTWEDEGVGEVESSCVQEKLRETNGAV